MHDDSRSGERERTLHTVATAITIFIFFTFGSPDSTIDHNAGCVSCSVYNTQICFRDARLEASWRLCLVAYLRTPPIQPPIAGSSVQITGFAVLFLAPLP